MGNFDQIQINSEFSNSEELTPLPEKTKKALITGVTGQDGSYLSEFLLEKGYEVYGVIRRSSSFNTGRIDHLFRDPHVKNSKFHLVYGDLTDGGAINEIIRKIMPDEVYNLGAQSHVRVSFDIPEYTVDANAIGTLKILEAIRNFCPKAKFYQASSSEIFGKVHEVPQKETTFLHPRSPYGCAKVFSYWITKNYRESYGVFACNGILFNHESERRGKTFVTRKITRGLSRIRLGIDDKIYLGNLDAKRDWGHAKDYVRAMWMMLQQENPDDFVIATGENHTVRELVELSAKRLGFDLEWQGEGVNEIGIDKGTGKVIVEIDEKYFRPAEVDELLGDYSKAKENLGWEPKIKFNELVSMMLEHDLKQEAIELQGKKEEH
jgi:GDPmannose 4,6-dehydratase